MSRPLFQKRHYQKLAETLRSVKPVSLYSQPNKTTLAAMLAWESAVVQTAKTLRQDNPAFDLARFLKAADANTLPLSKQS